MAVKKLQTRMIEVGAKADTQRVATAQGVVRLRSDVVRMILEGRLPKGNVLEVARVAGILAAKQTPSMIPLCHPLNITSVDMDFEVPTADGTRQAAGDRQQEADSRRQTAGGRRQTTEILIRATVRCVGKTGVEMEALTAVSAAALTIYDMCKTVQKDIEIDGIHLVEKTGGKSGTYRRAKE